MTTSLPPRELLVMVVTLADAKGSMPPKLRGAIKKGYGVDVQVTKTPGVVQYSASGGRVIPDLRFGVKAGAVILHSYKPGDWELGLKKAYDDLMAQSGAFEGLSIKLPEPIKLPESDKLPESITNKATRPPQGRKLQMRIGMQTWGTHGDIRPFLALAEGLQSAGHEVTLAITSINGEYDASVAKTGVKIESVASPVIRDRKEYSEIVKALTNEANVFKEQHVATTRMYLPAEAENYQVAQQLCNDNDLVIGHYWHYPLLTAAEQAGRDYVSVMLVPGLVPSSYWPPVGYPKLLGKFQLAGLAWSLIRWAYNTQFKTYPDRLRAAHGLKPAKDMIRDVFCSHQLTLIAISAQICEPQVDWPDYYQVCGFLNIPSLSIEGELSQGLEEFLSNGDPPVYITFGAYMPTDIPSQKETVALLSEAVTIANCRAIIQAPLWRECGLEPTQAVYYIHASPHGRVFPRCRAVIHHGGAGTGQAATLAGKPSIVVAHGADQKVWGRELERIGIARSLLARNMTAEQLAKSIREVTNSKNMQETAERIGAAMNRENGVGMAVKLINERFNVRSS